MLEHDLPTRIHRRKLQVQRENERRLPGTAPHWTLGRGQMPQGVDQLGEQT